MVTNILSVSEGMVTDDGTARAKFHVEYTCIAFRPFKGEVLDAVVTQVNKFGFFAEAGPLSIFVSNQLIEDDMTFRCDGENSYVSEDEAVKIVKGAEVVGCAVGMRSTSSEIFCIARRGVISSASSAARRWERGCRRDPRPGGEPDILHRS